MNGNCFDDIISLHSILCAENFSSAQAHINIFFEKTKTGLNILSFEENPAIP